MHQDTYYLKLGLFVHTYSQAEGAINLVFHRFAKVPPEVGNILKNETSASSVGKMIKALLRAHKFPGETAFEVTELLDQFNEITQFRHNVLHRGALPHESKPDTFVSNNAPTARGLEAFQEAEFSLSDLDAAIRDLRAICLRMLAVGVPEDYQIKPDLQGFAFAPWRYTPVALRTPYQSTKLKTPKQPRKQPPPRH